MNDLKEDPRQGNGTIPQAMRRKPVLPRAIRYHECTEADKHILIHAGPDGTGGAPTRYQLNHAILDNEGGTHGFRQLTIPFQNGPICEVGLTGFTIESILAVARDRLERFQDGSHACEENEQALRCIISAMQSLHERTKRRQRELSEGTSKPDLPSTGATRTLVRDP